MNRVELIGRLATDITKLTFDDGKQMSRFTIAVKGKSKDEAEFFSVVAWEKLAELVNKYCKKGDRVAVCGALKTNNYTSSKGEKWHAVEISAHEIEFLSNGNKETPKDKDLIPIDDTGDLPF